MTTREPEVLVLDTEDNTLRASLQLPGDLEFFEGHFEFESMLPAVVQVGWVVDFAADHLPVSGSADTIETLKFRKKLRPGDECELTVDWNPGENRLAFSFRQDDERVSSGQFTISP